MNVFKIKTPNTDDRWVIVILVIAFILMACIYFFEMSIFENYVEAGHLPVAGKDRLRLISFLSLAGIFLMTVFAIYQHRKIASRYKKATIESQQHLNFIEDLYNNAPIGFHSSDAEGVIIEMNQTELDWLGYEREEVIDKMKLSDISARDRKNFDLLMKQLFETGKLENVEGNLSRKDGTVMPSLSNSRIVKDKNGKLLYIRVAVMDFSKQKKLREDLKKASETAQQTAILKEQFVANMSHEIRTPLNGIIGFSNLLNRTELNQRQVEFVQNINASSQNLLAIVNDILDFSKIEAGGLRIEKIQFSPDGLVRSVENIFRYRAEEKQLNFEVNIEQAIPKTLVGDPNRLTQILVNLLGNAFKFTHEGSVILNVDITRSDKMEIMLRFRVADTGIGIPKNKLKVIFDRFGQATNATTREFGGTGLGLTITKQLVELQNGQIGVECPETGGAIFTVEIPYKIGVEKNRTDSENQAAANLLKNNTGQILLVEDNPVNLRVFELLLEGMGFRADHAENGRIGVEMLRKKDYDLVFMDIQMPEMDGYTATQKIRAELNLKVPIIATTAHVFSGEREKCISNGMDDYLAKPISESKLFALLKKYLPQTALSKEVSVDIANRISENYDWKYVLAVTKGKKELQKELVLLVTNQVNEEINSIEAALKANDFNTVAIVAHTMRSTVYSIGFNKPIGDVLMKLEAEARKQSLNETVLVFDDLKNLWEEGSAFLEKNFLS